MDRSKPKCRLIGTDGNVFALASKVIDCLIKNGMEKEVKEIKERLPKCKSYVESLGLFMEYVKII